MIRLCIVKTERVTDELFELTSEFNKVLHILLFGQYTKIRHIHIVALSKLNIKIF